MKAAINISGREGVRGEGEEGREGESLRGGRRKEGGREGGKEGGRGQACIGCGLSTLCNPTFRSQAMCTIIQYTSFTS